MSEESGRSRRGRIWFDALTGGAAASKSRLRSVCVADAALGSETARFIAVVPDAQNRFPRARAGEVGLDEGWALAHHVRATIAEGVEGSRRPIIAIVDVSSQAYGRLEELLGIHLACAAAADAYASARLAGHPVIALLVGKAMSGAFLAHGYQANRIIALDSPEVIEQEAGIEELDSTDRGLIWSLIGGEQRYAVGFADDLLEDDADAIAAAIRKAVSTELESAPPPARSAQVDRYAELLRTIDPNQPLDGESLRRLWKPRTSP